MVIGQPGFEPGSPAYKAGALTLELLAHEQIVMESQLTRFEFVWQAAEELNPARSVLEAKLVPDRGP